MVNLTLIILGNSNPDWEIEAIATFQKQAYDLQQVMRFNPSNSYNTVDFLSCLQLLNTINTEVTAILPANTQLNFLPPQLANTALAFLPPRMEFPLETARQ